MHVEAGTQPKVRRPFMMEMVEKMEACKEECGLEGRLCEWPWRYSILHASVGIGGSRGECRGVHEIYLLTRIDVFLRGDP